MGSLSTPSGHVLWGALGRLANQINIEQQVLLFRAYCGRDSVLSSIPPSDRETWLLVESAARLPHAFAPYLPSRLLKVAAPSAQFQFPPRRYPVRLLLNQPKIILRYSQDQNDGQQGEKALSVSIGLTVGALGKGLRWLWTGVHFDSA
ncbi:hypothetical protein OCU04_000410 [Sclerotinia nivalis]|uniref:Uncharacterized protein n=1 Tax=Sclerotinia nivalis TaxID=352851 RepID=A0A9X0DQA0_9HELO|nr:hypothetical protein OCU04_000410 [Sclerotinia nivalis]